jgi:TldD protein
VISRSATRRDFLSMTSRLMAGHALGMHALVPRDAQVIPSYSTRSPADFLPEVDATALQTVASNAVDAAAHDGATYADIRIGVQHTLASAVHGVVLRTRYTFGVRAFADHVWGFAYGREATIDAAVACARHAVASARVSAQFARSLGSVPAESWTPAPVARGEWRTPIRIDPFTVPTQQQAELAAAVAWTVAQTPSAIGEMNAEWAKEIRVFAATTGSLLTQHLYQGNVWASPRVQYGRNGIRVRVPGMHFTSSGYETLLAPDLQDRFKAAVEDAVWLARLPMKPLDVGRYPVVLDGYVMGGLLTSTIGPSAELDRVLGDDADASGTSRWPLHALGTPVASHLLTVSGHRMFPTPNAVQWDDDGVVPREHTIIRDGILTDYHTTGETVAALGDWYRKQGQSLQPNGCAMAGTADKPVITRAPHLVMHPGTKTSSLDDLCREMRYGVVVLNDGDIHVDQQFTSGTIGPESMMFEVSRGKIGRRIANNALRFNVIPFLKGMVALGDQRTACTYDRWMNKGMPWQRARQSASAPAALFREVDLVSGSRG